MTYFLKVDEDYEYHNELLNTLSAWLQDNVPGSKQPDVIQVHYGFQFLDGCNANAESWRELWLQVFNEYCSTYAEMVEKHFGFPVPPKRIACIYKVSCDAWTIYRIDFCLDYAETDGMYFYIVEGADTYMVQFQLMEMHQ